MIKRILLAVFVMALMLRPINVSAYEDEKTNSMADSVGATEIDSQYLDKDELSGDKNINVFQKLLDIITDSLKDNGWSVVKSFGQVFSAVILCSVMQAMKFGDNNALSGATAYISIILLSGVTYSVLYNLFIFAIAALETLSTTMAAFMPVMASLYAMSGATASAASSASGLAVFLTTLSLICTKVILPLLQISFALCLSGAIPNGINLSSVTTLVKNTATTLMGFAFTLMGFVLYLQTAVAVAGDNFFHRSVRFASGVFIPVIGNMLGEASRTVISSVSVIKSTVGAAGTVVILSLVLPPFLSAVLHRFMLSLAAVLAKSLGCEKEGAFLSELCGVTGVLMALIGGATVVCLIAMATFIRVGVSA